MGALKNMERIQTVQLRISECAEGICEYIVKNYKKHCISAFVWYRAAMLNRVPVKIIEGIYDLDVLKNLKYAHEIVPNLEESDKTIWEERISYFQARGIQIVDEN